MTREEAIICKIYLEDLDEFHTCNEYKLLIGLLDREPCDDCISEKDNILINKNNFITTLVWSGLLDRAKCGELARAIDLCVVEQEPCDVFDEYGNYKYPSDVELAEPNTATSMPCEDAISRQVAIKAAMQDVNDKRTNGFIAGATRAANRIKLLPSVNPQPKTGYWKSEHTGYYCDNYNCSECGFTKMFNYNERYNYCPNCGAKMEVSE